MYLGLGLGLGKVWARSESGSVSGQGLGLGKVWVWVSVWARSGQGLGLGQCLGQCQRQRLKRGRSRRSRAQRVCFDQRGVYGSPVAAVALRQRGRTFSVKIGFGEK